MRFIILSFALFLLGCNQTKSSDAPKDSAPVVVNECISDYPVRYEVAQLWISTWKKFQYNNCNYTDDDTRFNIDIEKLTHFLTVNEGYDGVKIYFQSSSITPISDDSIKTINFPNLLFVPTQNCNPDKNAPLLMVENGITQAIEWNSIFCDNINLWRNNLSKYSYIKHIESYNYDRKKLLSFVKSSEQIHSNFAMHDILDGEALEQAHGMMMIDLVFENQKGEFHDFGAPCPHICGSAYLCEAS